MTDTPILAAPDKAADPLPTVWDPNSRVGEMLKGKRGLVIGVANADSIAYGCAVKLRAFGADIALTYLNDKAKKHVEPLAEQIDASLLLPLDVDPARADAGGVRRASAPIGGGSISSSTRSPSRRATTCTAASSTARRPASCRRCRSPAIRSWRWRAWPSR